MAHITAWQAGSKHIYRKGLNSKLVVIPICQLFAAAAVEIICFPGADTPNSFLEGVVSLYLAVVQNETEKHDTCVASEWREYS